MSIISCIREKDISDELKRKILAQAAMGKNLKDPNYIPSDAEVVEALQKIEKRNNRNKIEQANDIVKLQKTIQEAEFYIKELEGNKKNFGLRKHRQEVIIQDYLKSLVDRDIWGTFNGGVKSSSDYAFRFHTESSNIMGETFIYYDGLNKVDKQDFNEAIVNIMDGNQEANNVFATKPELLKMAQKAHDKLKQLEEYQLDQLNKSGVVVDKIENYYFPTTHNQIKLANISEEEFIKQNIDRIDWARTETPNGDKMNTPEDKAEFLAKFRRSILDRGKDPFATGGGKNIIRTQLNQQRLLHFNSARSAFEYKKQFGDTKDIILDTNQSLIEKSEMYGQAKAIGSNPENNLDILLKYYRSKDMLSERQAKNIKELYLFKSGQTNEISNPILWNIYSGVKNYTYASIMGGVSIPSLFGDTASMSRALSQAGLDKNLVPVLQGLGKSQSKVVRQFLRNYGKMIRENDDAKNIFLKNLTATDGVMNMHGVMTRFDEGYNGFKDTYAKVLPNQTKTLKWSEGFARSGEVAANAVFNATGQTRLQRAMKDLTGQIYINGINHAKKYSLEELRVKDKGLYNLIKNEAQFTEETWNKLRNRQEDYTITDLLDQEDDVRDAFYKGFHSLQTLTVQEPSARIKSMKQRLSATRRKDSVGGILFDSLLMLKGFILQAVPNLVRRGRIGQSRNGSVGKTQDLASFALAATVSGMLIETGRAFVNGTTPPDYTDPEYLNNNMVGILSASGGLGIISDIMFYDYTKYGGSFYELAKGPLLDRADRAINILGEGARAPFSEDIDVPFYDTAQYIHSFIPFNNYFMTKNFTKTIFEDTILQMADEERYKQLQGNREERLREQRGQEFLNLFD